MSLVLVVAKEPSRAAICAELAARGVAHALLEMSRRPLVEAWLDRKPNGDVSVRWAGFLHTAGGRIALEDVTGIYWDVPSRIVDDPIAGVLGTLDCQWVNNPAAVAADTWPRRQERGARLFPSDRFLITDDKAAVRRLKCRPRSRRYFYTAPRLSERVIHFFVVGKRVFLVAVFEGRETVSKVSDKLGFTLSAYVALGGLTYSAVTFGMADNGRWIYLGSDPTADWTSYAERLNLPIAEAIADELTRPQSGTS